MFGAHIGSFLLVAAPLTCCAAQREACEAHQDCEAQEEVALLQRKSHDAVVKTGPWGHDLELVQGDSMCEFGEHTLCPGSDNVGCAGDQCCPGTAASGGLSFPCPSASPMFAACEVIPKVNDCTQDSSSVAIAAGPMWGAIHTSLSFVGFDVGTDQMSQQLPASTAIGILKSKGVTSFKLYSYSLTNLMDAIKDQFGNGGANLAVDIPNNELVQAATNSGYADNVLRSLEPYAGFLERISLGNEAFNAGPGPRQYLNQACVNLHNAIANSGKFPQLKITISEFFGIFQNSYPPSSTEVRPEFVSDMSECLQLIQQSGSDIRVNIYPYITLLEVPQVSVDYASCAPNHVEFTDKGLAYTNLLAAQYDGARHAFNKLGYSGVPLVIQETGWPTAGDRDANDQLAQRYTQCAIKTARRGTPLVRQPIRIYIFEAYDEDEKPGAPYETHFGVFTASAAEKFQVDWPTR